MLAIGKCNVQGAGVTREDATLSGEGGLFHLSYHTERASGRLNAKEVCGCMLPLLIKYIPVALLHPPVPVGMGDAVRK